MKCNSLEEVKKGIDNNYSAALEMLEGVQNTEDVEEKIAGIAFLGKFLSVYVTGLYSSNLIEGMLNKIGESIMPERVDPPKNKKTLFVMTEAAEGGGLTVLASNFIRWDDEEECSVVLTRMNGVSVPGFLKEAVGFSKGRFHYLEGGYIEKAKALKEIAKGYSKIVLMQHQDDVIPNLAFSSHDWHIPVYLYLHANFSLTYGLTIADRIMTINCYDIEKAVKFRGINRDRLEYFQFPNDGRLVSSEKCELSDEINEEYAAEIAAKYAIDTSKKIVVTMAEDFKLEDIVGCSFIGFIENLVNTRKGDVQYIVIGPHPHTKRWKELEERTNGQAKAVGYLTRKEATAIISLASLYIVSFPMSASGNMVAEAFKVPFLTYALTERGRERQDKKTLTVSIDDLINKSNDILNGNSAYYILGERENILPHEEWKQQWANICKIASEHSVYEVSYQRIIEEEELINYQLMQDRAEGEMLYFLRNHKLDFRNYETIQNICRKYNLGILNNTVYCIDENYYSVLKKNSFFSDYVTKWLIMELNNVSLEEFFQRNNIDCISIYGAGAMGQILYRKLKNSTVEVECFIDRAQNRYALPCKLIGIDKLPDKSKIIVNTAYGNNIEIRSGYRALTEDYSFISLFEIIDEMFADSRCV